MSVEITDETISWIMKRNGIPDELRNEFEQIITTNINQSNFLDSMFYRCKEAIKTMAQIKGLEIKPNYEMLESEPMEYVAPYILETISEKDNEL